MFTIRKIESSDRAEVFALSKKIWEGNDYIPNIFDKWVSGDQGEFTAVIKEGKIVGFGRLTYITGSDVWLEGLRSDPDAQVRGIGRLLINYYLELLRQNRQVKSIRFATYFENIASISTAEKLGFKLILTMSHKFCELDSDENWHLSGQRVEPSITDSSTTYDEILAYMEPSEYLEKSRNLICLGWIVYPYTKETVKKLFLDRGQYFVHKTGDKITGMLLYDIAEPISSNSSCNICFIKASDPEIAIKLIQSAKIVAVGRGLDKIQVKVPKIDYLFTSLQEEGFQSRKKEDDFIVYEYPQELL